MVVPVASFILGIFKDNGRPAVVGGGIKDRGTQNLFVDLLSAPAALKGVAIRLGGQVQENRIKKGILPIRTK